MVERLKEMWKTQQHEMEGLDINNKSDFKHYNDLPLARIKRIMKSDENCAGTSVGPPTNLSILCAKESDAKTRWHSGPHWRV
jgi:nuclear transcription factor Y gamma